MAVFKCAGYRRLDDEGKPACSYEAKATWRGHPCPSCGRFYDVIKFGAAVEDKPERKRATLGSLANSDATIVKHLPTGIADLDHVLDGGLVEGQSILFGGQNGAGKSSLLVELAGARGAADYRVLYASGEQSTLDVGRIARRLGQANDHVEVLGMTRELEIVLERAREARPKLVVFDSLQALYSNTLTSPPNSAAQGIAVAALINEHCKKTGMVAFIVNHVTKEGEFAGREAIQHEVDTVLVLGFPDEKVEGDRKYLRDPGVRVLGSAKNRFGEEMRRAYLRMTDKGLRPVSEDPPKPGFLSLVRDRLAAPESDGEPKGESET